MGRPRVLNPNRRVHSINFDPAADDWVESLVARLTAIGYPKAGRSGVVREALQDLREKLAGRSDAEILRFFLDRDAGRLFTSVGLDRSAPNREEET